MQISNTAYDWLKNASNKFIPLGSLNAIGENRFGIEEVEYVYQFVVSIYEGNF